MKFMIIAILAISTSVSAKTFKCEVKSTNENAPKEYIVATVDYSIDSIDYIHQTLTASGEYVEQTENIYGGLNRGGYTVYFCNPNLNKFDKLTGKMDIHGQCAFGNPGDKLLFDADLGTQADGSISIVASPRNERSTERLIEVGACL